jgi:hypothetical protein
MAEARDGRQFLAASFFIRFRECADADSVEVG